MEKANNNNKNSWNNFDNNRSKNNNNKNKNKKKKGWASELDNNYDGSKEIKQEDNEGEVINFEKQDEFGGYTIDKNDKWYFYFCLFYKNEWINIFKLNS